MKKKVVLIGAGLSGLSALYFFLKKNADKVLSIEIYEKENTVGGVLKNTKKHGFLFEHGAQGVLSTRKNFIHLVEEINIKSKLIASSSKSSARAFFYRNNILYISPKHFFKLTKHRLISFFGIFRIFFEIFISKKSPKSETVQKFFSRRFGTQVASHFIKPIMKGIWGGGSDRILMKYAFPQLKKIEDDHGSIIKYFFKSWIKKQDHNKEKKSLYSFSDGMIELPNYLYKSIQEICQNHQIDLNMFFNYTDKIKNEYDLLIYSAQPWRDSNPLVNFPKDELTVLKNIPTHTLVTVGIGAKNNPPKFEGFGILSVENNEQGVLGVISVHSIYPKHLPENSFLYRVILGGENLPTKVNLETATDEQIINLAKDYLSKYNLIEKNKTYDFEAVERFPNYIPLPTDYQSKVLDAVNQIESKMPGVFLAGNYQLGPAIENCIAHSQTLANKMSNYILKN